MDKVILVPEVELDGSLSREAETELTINTCTFGAGTTTITTPAAHGLLAGQKVRFTTTGTLPAAINTGTDYYVNTTATSTTLTIVSTVGGTAITFATAGTGTHTMILTDRTLISKYEPGRLAFTAVVNNLGGGIVTLTETYLPDGFVNKEYELEQLFDSAIIFTVSSGTLPPGITLTQPTTSSVLIGGTPTTVGDYAFTTEVERNGAVAEYLNHIIINASAGGGGGGSFTFIG